MLLFRALSFICLRFANSQFYMRQVFVAQPKGTTSGASRKAFHGDHVCHHYLYIGTAGCGI